MRNATGIVEVYGLVAAFVACDAGCKAANVTVETFDKNKPGNPDGLEVPLIVAIKFRGSVTDVQAAVEAAIQAANGVSGVMKLKPLSFLDGGLLLGGCIPSGVEMSGCKGNFPPPSDTLSASISMFLFKRRLRCIKNKTN